MASTNSTLASTTTARGMVTKQLSTGQTITLTMQDDKLLKNSFNYLSGFSKRSEIIQTLHEKRLEYSHLKRLNNRRNIDADEPKILREDKQQFIDDLEAEINELTSRLKEQESVDKRSEKISFKDLEMVLIHYGMTPTKRLIDTMIWEVDENCDEMIDYDEYQLTYYRNINDKTKNEPFTFFHVQQYLCWDETHKGYIMEDDCMEVLFSRLGRCAPNL